MDSKSAVVGAFLAGVICIGLMSMHDERAKRRAGLLADSLAAARDTTRSVQLANGVLAADKHLLQRRIIQTEQRADSIDRALHLERRMRAEVVGHVEPVIVERYLTAPVQGDTGTRIAEFTIRETPYTVTGIVALPPAPAAGAVTLRIAQDSLPLDFRIHCGERNPEGIRAAHLAVVAPEWFNVNLRSLEQSPDVCNAARPRWRASWTSWAGLRDRIGVNVGYGAVVTLVGVRSGPGVFASVRAWP